MRVRSTVRPVISDKPGMATVMLLTKLSFPRGSGGARGAGLTYAAPIPRTVETHGPALLLPYAATCKRANNS